MLELFDKDFFKFTIGFVVIISFSLFILGVTGVLKYGEEHEAVVGQRVEEGRD